MDIINFDIDDDNNNNCVHHWLLPNSIRCIIAGGSGCGKTNLLMNLIMRSGFLNYDRLHIYSKSLHQTKYQLLQDWALWINKNANDQIISFHSDGNIISVEDLNPAQRTVIVFDDVMLEKQSPIEKYFSQGRHGGADCFYLCQSYFRIPKQAIRDNANLLILFAQDAKNLRAIHDTFVSGDMNFNEFRQFFRSCTGRKYGFAVIDLSREIDNGKYRCGFDRCYIPTQCMITENNRT